MHWTGFLEVPLHIQKGAGEAGGGGAEITKDLLPGINYMEESPVGATTFHHHYLRSGKNHQK